MLIMSHFAAVSGEIRGNNKDICTHLKYKDVKPTVSNTRQPNIPAHLEVASEQCKSRTTKLKRKLQFMDQLPL